MTTKDDASTAVSATSFDEVAGPAVPSSTVRVVDPPPSAGGPPKRDPLQQALAALYAVEAVRLPRRSSSVSFQRGSELTMIQVRDRLDDGSFKTWTFTLPAVIRGTYCADLVTWARLETESPIMTGDIAADKR